MSVLDRITARLFKSEEEQGVFRRMASENFRVYRNQYAVAIVCLLITAGITAYSAWLMGPIVKDVFYGNDMNRATFLSVLVVFIFLLKGGVSYLQTVILQRIGNNIVARYRRRLFAHMLQLNVGFFTAQHSVALISRINSNVIAVRDMLNTVILGYVRDLVTLIGLIGVMIYRDPIMSLAILIIGPLALTTLAGYARRVKRIARQEVQVNAGVATAMQEAAHGISIVKSFTLEEQLSKKLDALTVQAELQSNKIARITARTSPLMETLAGFCIAAVIAYGGWRVINQGYEPSDLTSFMTALLLAYEPAKKLARLRVTLERSMVNARMIYEILDTDEVENDSRSIKPFTPQQGEIAFDDVHFSYEAATGMAIAESKARAASAKNAAAKSADVKSAPAQPPVISGMSFVAEAGKTTALVGPSGGGKSTIVSLIQRFYEPDSGTISVDGQNIAEVATHELRSNIAYVSQSPILFQGTVRENLRYARPDATDKEIETAARHAQAHDFIVALPKGYDSVLGENGTSLSGGQRQRLSIARALVRNAPILLLDEATSALDNESEAQVQKALDTLMNGRTTLVIAHRLSTIASADKIIVIDGGKVADQGTHAQLMKRKKGVYAKLQNLGAG